VVGAREAMFGCYRDAAEDTSGVAIGRGGLLICWAAKPRGNAQLFDSKPQATAGTQVASSPCTQLGAN
jgi:hypothetical protein